MVAFKLKQFYQVFGRPVHNDTANCETGGSKNAVV